MASLVSAVLSYPRFCLALRPRYPVWYFEAVQFLGGIVLWGFVFAWYTKYTGRPVFTLEVDWQTFVLTTVLGLAFAALLYLCQDPPLRRLGPEDFPSSPPQWLARVLFNLGFEQLFLIFAPFAWLMRLFQRKRAALTMTVLFGVFVLLVRNQTSKAPASSGLLLMLVAVRIVTGLLSVALFLRGGVWLVCWYSLLVQSRLVLDI